MTHRHTSKICAGVLLFSFLLFVRLSLAAPALTQYDKRATNVYTQTRSNSTQFEPVWVAGPPVRGTLSLIFSCVITLFLCIWTAVKVNIEPKGSLLFRTDSKTLEPISKLLGHHLVRKFGWSCVTVIVPEATLTIAAQERKTAHQLTKAINDYTGDPKKWTHVQSFYVLMGGITLPDSAHCGGENTLTPQGVLLCYERGRPPQIMENDVLDRSKETKFTQLIVSFQALWMIVNVIGRAAGGLPVTILELHICLHTFCALITYIFWWNKPADVNETTEIEITDSLLDELKKLHAKGYDGSPNADRSPEGLGSFQANENCILADPPNQRYLLEDTITERERGKGTLISADEKTQTGEEVAEQIKNITNKVSIYEGYSKADSYLTSRAGLGCIPLRDLLGGDSGGYWGKIGGAYQVLNRSKMVKTWEGFVIVSVGFLYGALHLTAWAEAFPSYPEMILWRAAAGITAISWGSFSLSLYLNLKGLREIYPVFFGLGVPFVLIIRLFLLIESFLCLRALPLGSYKVNRWSELWPHGS